VGILTSAIPHGLYHFGYDKSLLENDVPNSYVGILATNFRTAIPNATGMVGISNAAYALTHPLSWDVDAIFVFVNCVLFITLSREYLLPKWMPHGSEVLLATGFATVFGMYANYPGGIVGDIPSGNVESAISLFGTYVKMPFDVLDATKLMNVPIVDRCFDGSFLKLIISASVFSVVNYLSIVAISTGFEREDGIPWSANRELMAQGASNVVAGLVGSAPVSGSMSRSLVSRMTGSTSRLACIVTSLLWICMMPYMSIMSNTPKSALCAVMVSAVLTNVVNPTRLLALRGYDSFVGLGTAFASSTMNPTMGFVFGCVLHVSVLGGMKSKELKSSRREKAE
jgi:MFS superfamily sulfate permease-like transporter